MIQKTVIANNNTPERERRRDIARVVLCLNTPKQGEIRQQKPTKNSVWKSYWVVLPVYALPGEREALQARYNSPILIIYPLIGKVQAQGHQSCT